MTAHAAAVQLRRGDGTNSDPVVASCNAETTCDCVSAMDGDGPTHVSHIKNSLAQVIW